MLLSSFIANGATATSYFHRWSPMGESRIGLFIDSHLSDDSAQNTSIANYQDETMASRDPVKFWILRERRFSEKTTRFVRSGARDTHFARFLARAEVPPA